MDYKVTDLQSGLYDCDTLFIEIDTETVQVPVSKKVGVTSDIIGKLVTINNLYIVPLDTITLATV